MIAECGLSGSNEQVENLNGRFRPAMDPKPCLPWGSALFAFSKTAYGEELGESSDLNASLHAADLAND